MDPFKPAPLTDCHGNRILPPYVSWPTVHCSVATPEVLDALQETVRLALGEYTPSIITSSGGACTENTSEKTTGRHPSR